MKDLKVKGKILQVVGPIVDVSFKDQHLPELLTALEIPLSDGRKLTVEVAQHIGDDAVRCVSMGPTEGLVRGMEGNVEEFKLVGVLIDRQYNSHLKLLVENI